ncbi:MAG: helix-turn-helix domain-containing protein [Acutalibacteraceae bacterium]
MNEFDRLGSEIKSARISNNLSQEALAEMLDVSSTHIKHMESGHRKPSVEILFKLAKILNFSIDSIIFDDKESNKSSQIDEDISLVLKECSCKEKELIKQIIISIVRCR